MIRVQVLPKGHLQRGLALAILLFHAGCGDDATSPDPLPSDPPPLATAAIGAAGGELIHDAVRVGVPAGAFADEATLTLHATDLDPEETGASTYRIDGIPARYDAPLELRFPSGAPRPAGEDTTWVLIGSEVRISGGATPTKVHLTRMPLTVDGDQLTLPIPSPDDPDDEGARRGDPPPVSLHVVIADGTRSALSPAGHFRMTWQSGRVDPGDVAVLAQALDDAHQRYLDLDFSYARRTRWPVDVTILPLAESAYGFYGSSVWGDDWGAIEINQGNLDQHDEITATASHEFFHLVQALYDPRWAYTQAKFGPAHLWLDEATAVWSEAIALDDPDYLSPVRQGQELAPFRGAVPGPGVDAGEHGYGMSTLARHLIETFGEDVFARVYEGIRAERSAMGSIDLETESIVTWWDAFIRAYVEGELYRLSPALLLGDAAGSHAITGPDDDTWTVTHGYQDLSARVFQLNLQDDTIPDGSELHLDVDGDFSDVAAYVRTGGTFSPVAVGGTSVTVPDLDGAAAQLLIVVTNARAIPDFTDATSITLTATLERAEEPDDLSRFDVVRVDWCYELTYEDPDESTWTQGFCVAELLGEGTVTGHDFSYVIDQLPEGSVIRYTGTVTGSLSEDLSEVATLVVDLRAELEDGGALQYTAGVSAMGVPLLIETDDVRWYRADGAEACAVTTSVSHVTSGGAEAVAFGCRTSDDVSVRLLTELPR